MHARLENISAEGTWIQSESFVMGETLCEHEAGKSVGRVMSGWRKLRAAQPALFAAGIRVWQSPTAFVDAVIYKWQQDLEASQNSCQIRIVDAFKSASTEQAMEHNWLCNAAQVCVAPGCTPLMQVTDTGLSMPSKAAARTDEQAENADAVESQA